MDEEIVDVIDAGVASLTKGTNLFYGPFKPADNRGTSTVPGLACFVFISGGVAPEHWCNGNSGGALKRIALQILVRGPKGTSNDYKTGIDLAEEVHTTVDIATTATSLTAGVRAQQSGPIYLGEDNQGYHQWSINVIAFKEV
jgi:hypothetical protein